MPTYVRGEGRRDADLMVVGEAPGFHEDESGRPFVGPSGSYLDQFLEHGGTDRASVYVTNVVKYRPPDNKLFRLKEIGINIADGLPELYNEIRTVRPNCILALGNTPLRYLTGRSGKGNQITENRGSILTTLGVIGHYCKVVPTYHPAHLLHMHGGEVDDTRAHLWVEFDVKRAVEESKYAEYNVPKRHLAIARNSLDTWRFLERYKTRNEIAIDIEVINSIPICIGIAFSADESLTIPLLDFSSAHHKGRLCSTSRDVAESLRALAKFLDRRDLDIFGQNFKFDHSKLEGIWIRINGRILDTMLMHHTLYPEFPKSLEFMLSVHSREPFYKSEGREFNFKTDKLEDYLLYNGRDVCCTFELGKYLKQELIDLNLWEFYIGFQKDSWKYPFGVEKLHDLYMRMEETGFPYDKDKNAELKKKYKGLIASAQVELDMLAGTEINVNSWKQVGYLIYEHFKMPKRAGTSEDVLVGLMNSPQLKEEDHRTVLKLILRIRKLRKNISTYLNTFPDFDGRMRTSYNIVGTENARTSTQMQRPPVRPHKMGLAFQTMTKHGDIGPDLRKEFPCDPGYVYLQADAKQAEARVVFLLARLYDRLLQMDDPSYDIHSITSSWFFPGETPQQIKKQPEKRFTGKTIRHAGHLGMGKNRCMHTFNSDAEKFGLKNMDISEWKAGKLLEQFHENDPNIKGVFWQEVRDALDATKILVSPFGRRRQFFGDDSVESFYKEALSFIPQASIADNTKRAMLGIREEIQDIRYVLEWHDGFLALVPEKEVEIFGRVFMKWMEKAINFKECTLSRDFDLIIPCELEFSDTTYYDLKKYELGREHSDTNQAC